ncbi:MAG TPA: hypothetical protein VGL38_11570 [bacterium]|jgi:hypothetical protein
MRILITALLLVLASSLALSAPTIHDSTEWDLQPSLTYDALCLLNTLSADSFYLDYYQKDYNELAPKLTPEAKTALAAIRHGIKDEMHGIISAALCLYFSAVNDTTLDQLVATVDHPETMQAALKQTPYYDEQQWQGFMALRPALRTVFVWMKQTGFDAYWHSTVLPKVQRRIEEIRKDLPHYNVIGEDEALLGAPLPSHRITVYMLYYCQPHGIKIVGTRFLSDVAYPFDIVVRNAAHEMMHPPFDLSGDSVLVAALNTLQQDTFLMDKVLHHNPDFGYNDFPGFIEEDCVQALEQTANRSMGIAPEPRQRWTQSDDGMHVFAVALYSVMTAENYNAKHERFSRFLIRMIQSGRLAPGKIKTVYDAFYASK